VRRRAATLLALGLAVACGTSDHHVQSADDAYAVSRDSCHDLTKSHIYSVSIRGVDELVQEWMASWEKGGESFSAAAESGCRAGAQEALAGG
jgi:hypothetical protein